MGLSLSTRELQLPTDFDLTAHLPKNALSYIRGGQGLVGVGESLRLSASGPNRMQVLAAQWRSLVLDSSVDDQVNLPGTGLVAFGSFAFADGSESESVLIVPQALLGVRDGRAWLTVVDGASVEDFWSKPAAYDRNPAVQFAAGQQTAAEFKLAVADAVSAIGAGTVEKVVLARDLVGQLPQYFDIRPVLAKLASKYPTCWVYSVAGLFGASPELLVRVAHGQVSARVLAGTAGRGTDPGVDAAIASALVASEKNLVEHAFAVDSLVQALEPFCTKVDADTKPFSLALPNLWHLASDVHGVLRGDASVLDLAAALHPTAAVAGTPRAAVQSLLAELEGFDRGRYAGPVGWIGADGDGEWAIALRGAQIETVAAAQFETQQVRAFAGCGIVAGSDPEAELAETELKFQPIRDALS